LLKFWENVAQQNMLQNTHSFRLFFLNTSKTPPPPPPKAEKLTQHDSDFNTWKTTKRPNQRNRPIPNFFHSTLVIHHRPKSKGRGWRVKLFKVFPTRWWWSHTDSGKAGKIGEKAKSVKQKVQGNMERNIK